MKGNPGIGGEIAMGTSFVVVERRVRREKSWDAPRSVGREEGCGEGRGKVRAGGWVDERGDSRFRDFGLVSSMSDTSVSDARFLDPVFFATVFLATSEDLFIAADVLATTGNFFPRPLGKDSILVDGADFFIAFGDSIFCTFTGRSPSPSESLMTSSRFLR